MKKRRNAHSLSCITTAPWGGEHSLRIPPPPICLAKSKMQIQLPGSLFAEAQKRGLGLGEAKSSAQVLSGDDGVYLNPHHLTLIPAKQEWDKVQGEETLRPLTARGEMILLFCHKPVSQSWWCTDSEWSPAGEECSSLHKAARSSSPVSLEGRYVSPNTFLAVFVQRERSFVISSGDWHPWTGSRAATGPRVT